MNNSAEQDNNEEILLYNADSADTIDAPDENSPVSVKFAQRDKEKLQGKKLIIYDNQYLNVTDYQYKKKSQYWINLTYLNPKPRWRWFINWRWLWGGMSCAAFALGAWFTPIVEWWLGATHYQFSIVILLATVALLCLVALVRQSKHVVQFDSLNGAVPFLELLNNNPERGSFQAFLSALVEKINIAQHNKQYLDNNEHLAAELTEHRQLLEKGVINTAQYEQAKQRLFAMHRQ